MSRINDQIAGINGVVAGGVATVNLDVGRRYHGLSFYYKGNAAQATIEADILYIYLYVNTVLIREIIPSELFNENAANGRAFNLGEIPIFFSEPWRASVMSEEATAWDMFGQLSFTAKLAIAGAAVAPAVTGVSQYDYLRNVDQSGAPALNIVKWVRNSFNLSLGQQILTQFEKGKLYQRQTFTTTAGNELSAFLVTLNGQVQRNVTRTEIANVVDAYQITQQAATSLLYWDYSQQITDALEVGPTAAWQIQVTSPAAQGCNVLSQIRVPGYQA